MNWLVRVLYFIVMLLATYSLIDAYVYNNLVRAVVGGFILIAIILDVKK